MKNMKTILIYVMLVISLLVMSVATTLALVTDEHSTSDAVIKFDKVSLMGDSQDGTGSKLSLTLDNVTGNGEVVFNNELNPEHYLMVKPTNDTAPCYIRFRIYFSLETEKLNEEYSEELGYLNDPELMYDGFELNNNENYAFKQSEDWIYLVTAEENSNFLKVVTKDDNATGYILSKKYTLYVNGEAEGKISDLSTLHNILLKVEVEAIQTYNLTGLTDEEMDEILDSSTGEMTPQQIYGGATIEDYIEASSQNAINNNGPITIKFNYNNSNLAKISGDNEASAYGKINDVVISIDEEIKLPIMGFGYVYNSNTYTIDGWLGSETSSKVYDGMIDYKTIGKLSKGKSELVLYANWKQAVTIKVADANTSSSIEYNVFMGTSYRRDYIGFIKLIGDESKLPTTTPTSTHNIGVINNEVSDQIKLYIYKKATNNYQAYIYQEGAVILNPDSSRLFMGLGTNILTSIDTTDWDINTINVTNVNDLFHRCGCYSMQTMKLAENFDFSRITTAANTFNSIGYTKLHTLDVSNFGINHTQITNTANMFAWVGIRGTLTVTYRCDTTWFKALNKYSSPSTWKYVYAGE